jgi:hypothetical protein
MVNGYGTIFLVKQGTKEALIYPCLALATILKIEYRI